MGAKIVYKVRVGGQIGKCRFQEFHIPNLREAGMFAREGRLPGSSTPSSP